MKKIRRIYVTHFGSPTAWYDKALFDLTDPDTREAVDTVFNLENGGGKTTLMSFIFSCFEPDERRWIQHLRKSDRKFQDYFVSDGRPAVIMIEWDMPEKSAGAGGYQLTMGQVVGMIDTKDRGLRAERYYFAFESLDGVTFDDVPILDSKNISPVRSTSELVDWLHSQRSNGLSVTKVQSDWVDELANRRNIDVELLQRQVDFNSAEGGMDEGFLRFKTEEEFLRLFLGLTLSPSRCAKVRQAVSESVQQQSNRPRLKARLTAMERLKSAIAPLVERFGELKSAEKHCNETKSRAAALRDEIQRLADFRAESARQAGALKAEHRKNHESASGGERAAVRDYIAILGLQHQRDATAAAIRKDQAAKEEKEVKERLDHLQAARIFWQASAAKLRGEELDATIELQREGLQNYVNDANHNGAMLHALLLNQSAVARRQAKEDEKKADDQKRLSSELQTQRGEADKALRAAQTLLATATAVLEAGERELDALQTEGLMFTDDASAQVAIDRFEIAQQEARACQRELEQNLRDWGNRAEACEKSARTETEARAQHDRAALEPKRTFDAGIQLSDSIQDSALIKRVAESDAIDPDSLVLPKALGDHLAMVDQAIRDNAVDAAQIQEDKSSIEETGLAGRNHDVEQIIRRLVEGGVRSARPANTYLADIHRDAAAARALLISDPALHLGVTVASGEWDKALAVLSGLDELPSRPVTVGTNRTTASDSRGQQFTVGPASDAIINRPAATAMLDQVNQRLVANGRRKDELVEAAEQCRDALEAVHRYQREYGRDKIEAARLQFTRLESEAHACGARADEAWNQARMLREQVKTEQPKVGGYSSRASTAKAHADRLRRYQAAYEREREQRLEERSRAQSASERLSHQIETLEQQAREAHAVSLELKNSASRYIEQASNLSAEAERITHRKSAADVQRLLGERPRALEDLREVYRASAELLNLEERNRIGAAVFQRDQALESYKQLRGQLKKEHASVSDHICERYKGLDFEAEIPRQRLALDSARTGCITAVEHASSTKATLEGYWRTQQERVLPTPQMIGASDAELQRMADAAKADGERFARIAQREEELERQASRDEDVHSKAADAHRGALRTLTTAMPLVGVAAGAAVRMPDGNSGEDLVASIAAAYQEAEQTRARYEKRAQEAFTQYQKASNEASVVEAEPEIANSISSSTFDQTRTDVERLSQLISERLSVVQSTLDKLDLDLQGVAEELYGLTYEGMRLFQHALSKNVPARAPWVGGKAFMTTSVNHMGMAVAERKAVTTNYLHELISNKISARGDLPIHGAHMAARCLLAMSGKSALGLKLLTMEQNPDHQFRPVGSLKVSDGQGSVIAMFIYLLISQLRADTQVKGGERAGGGPLFLDNPFAKVQTKALIDIQRQVAAAADVQLVFFTANGDPNILAGFPRMIRLKKSGMSSRTGRSHVEFVSCSPADATEVANA